MCNVTNYYEQSRGLPAQNGFQIAILRWTDTSTLIRETTKLGTVIGLVCLASSVIFNFDPTKALMITAVCGISWLLAGICAQKLEPQAKGMIQHFKELRDVNQY